MTGVPRTVPAALGRLVDQLPDHDALITDDRSFTSCDLRNDVYAAAAALIGLGVAPKDRVARVGLMMPLTARRLWGICTHHQHFRTYGPRSAEDTRWT